MTTSSHSDAITAQAEPVTIANSFKTTLPVLFGYVPMGMAFGLLLADQGYAWYWATIMGVVIFAGAAQFMAIGLLAASAGLFEVAMTTLLLNSRHIFYGLSLIHHLKAKGWHKLYIIFGLTDETYSLLTAHHALKCQTNALKGQDSSPKNQGNTSAQQNGIDTEISTSEDLQEGKFQFIITALNHSYWVLGCTIGALLGGALTFDTNGLEFTLPALFMVLVIEQYKATQKIFPFVIALACAIASLMLFDSDSMLLISITMTLTLLLGKQQLDVRGITVKRGAK
ncbi:AzlC family ABC transporter permease [Alkalimarinus sediminis]|uniref:AzlC family ABC transporter permease n=1 Tax=Alkalimarinus sediminis TaxID=1632866 RepID=A0A9E8HGQ3_9ALTE|nr:AzlC family ABC transporter permease [Alkalimarinus sediminis]UZW74353.1 AzlC family ABC transporter permease [Alkalimarinus sediminis]